MLHLRSLLLTLLLLPATAAAQNLVPNPNFDDDQMLSSWENVGSLVTWDMDVDVDDAADSGSMRFPNRRGAGLRNFVYSCGGVEISEGDTFDYGAMYRILPQEPQSGQVELRMIWWSAPTCQVGGSSVSATPTTAASVVGDWAEVASRATAPAGAKGFQLELSNRTITGMEGTDFVIHYDDAFVVPEPTTSGCLAAVVTLAAIRRRPRRP